MTQVNKKIVVFDFDGVINSYRSRWKGIDNIPDPPVSGIKEAIDNIRKEYNVVVVSTRCATQEGINAIKEYLNKYDIVVDSVQMEKPPCIVTIDDRALCFNGNPAHLLDEINNFKPWWETKIYQSCTLFGKDCIYINDYIDIPDRNQNPLYVYYIMMDSEENPIKLGTGVCPGFNVYGTILSVHNFMDHHDSVINGDYFMDLPKDFHISDDYISLEQYRARC